MCRVAARRVVAGVTGKQFAKRSFLQFVSTTMRANFILALLENSISTIVHMAHPGPAFIRATDINAFPKLCFSHAER